MKNDNHIQTRVLGPADDLVEVRFAALGKMLGAVDDAFEEPVPDRYPDGVEAV